MALNSSTFCGKATVFLAVMPTLSSTPFLFRLALHRRRFLVLELEPVRRPSRTVARAEPLRDDPLQQCSLKSSQERWSSAMARERL
jgi:hypothetical protein